MGNFISGPRQSPVDGDFSFHQLDDELVVSALGEGVEEIVRQLSGLPEKNVLHIDSRIDVWKLSIDDDSDRLGLMIRVVDFSSHH